MILATCKVTGTAAYSQSRPHDTPKLSKELAKDYETRTWKERVHADKDGNVFIPAMAFKNCIAECAKYMSIQIPGKGKSTYTKHFEAGVMVLDNIDLNIHKDDIESEWVFVPVDGRKGCGSRVWKNFPYINPGWTATVKFYILDETITEDVFRDHLTQAGNFIGLGRFRPRNGGMHGRFTIDDVKWEAVKGTASQKAA